MITNIGKKRVREEYEEAGIFADPTYDMTFKMLFGNDKNKDILISLLNSLLGFNGDKEIIDVIINSGELEISGIEEVKSRVDVLCTTLNNQKIAVEMQRQYKEYFLARTQGYMSKLISAQVKVGESRIYHEAMMDTYVLCIEKENVFNGIYKLKDDSLFEITVVPTVVETGEVVPENKMNWKFFELPKFVAFYGESREIDEGYPLKMQWLDFLVTCKSHLEVPENINEIIKKAYEIMKRARWTQDQEVLYWKQKADEISEKKETERLLKKAATEAKIEGKIEGKIKGEISKVKALVKYNIPKKNILEDINFLVEDNIDYISNHIDDTDSIIYSALQLGGASSSALENHDA